MKQLRKSALLRITGFVVTKKRYGRRETIIRESERRDKRQGKSQIPRGTKTGTPQRRRP